MDYVCQQARNIGGRFVYGRPHEAEWAIRSVPYNHEQQLGSTNRRKRKAPMSVEEHARYELERHIRAYEHMLQQEAGGVLSDADARTQVWRYLESIIRGCVAEMKNGNQWAGGLVGYVSVMKLAGLRYPGEGYDQQHSLSLSLIRFNTRVPHAVAIVPRD